MIAILKRDSTKWLKTKKIMNQNFHWQNGYGIFSVSESTILPLMKYIENQKDHHSRKSFKEEFIDLLKKYNMGYNEKYLWD
jgi:REP element-mobilizing transposase RayT